MNQTKRILLSAAAVAVAAAVPASAHGPADHAEKAKGPKSEKTHGTSKSKGKTKSCTPRKKGYVAAGTVEAAALTKNADGTYDGTLTVAVTKTNHHAGPHKGTSQTYTLDDAKVNLADADGNGTIDAADALPGQRAKVIGKITVLKKRCDASAFTPTVTVRKATLRLPKAPETPEQPEEQPETPAPTT
jgi:hypothetical protein